MTPENAAKNLVGLYGTNEAIRIIQKELEVLNAKCDFLNQVFENIINRGTAETEQQ